MDWVENFVIKYELCPFAARPFSEGRVVAVEITTAEEDTAFFEALTQVQHLLEQQSDVETSLLVFTNLLTTFNAFLDFVFTFEQALQETGANELVQLAHFHPDYCFAGVAVTDPGNLTNRAPYPVLQLLRVRSVTAAVAHYPEVDKIPERNVARLRRMFSER